MPVPARPDRVSFIPGSGATNGGRCGRPCGARTPAPLTRAPQAASLPKGSRPDRPAKSCSGPGEWVARRPCPRTPAAWVFGVGSAGATGGGVAAFEGAALLLGQAAPDPGLLSGLKSPFQAGRGDLTATAYGLGFFCLDECGASVPVREEQLGVLAQAGSAVAPGHHGRAPWVKVWLICVIRVSSAVGHTGPSCLQP